MCSLALDVPFKLFAALIFLSFQHNYTEQPQLALTEGFKDLDHHWLEMAALNGWDDGSTAVSVLIVNRTIYVANVGDSRAVLCTQGGRAIDMSADHKPARDDEKARIEKLGGRVIHYGTWRVQGVLAVSRSIGVRGRGGTNDDGWGS